jgi:hypothetical protein
MTDIFIKKSRWFDFANEHNKKVNVSATLLNGSKSYTLAALHMAAGKAIPLSIRFDIARSKGVADHFNGLRQFYESDKEPNRWIKSVAAECRKFAVENSLDSDELIRNVIMLTDRSVYGTDGHLGKFSLKAHEVSQYSNYLPSKEDFESSYRTLTSPGKTISIDSVLDQLEINAKEKGLSLKSNWRMITEKNIEIWAKKR